MTYKTTERTNLTKADIANYKPCGSSNGYSYFYYSPLVGSTKIVAMDNDGVIWRAQSA